MGSSNPKYYKCYQGSSGKGSRNRKILRSYANKSNGDNSNPIENDWILEDVTCAH